MFTGLIERMGTVRDLRDGATARRLSILSPNWPPSPQLGESIAIDGCCLALVEADGAVLSFDAIP